VARIGWKTRATVGKQLRWGVLGPLSGAKSLIVSDVQPSLRAGIAPVVTLLASMSPALARVADEASHES
jgi:hypothetical protein